MVKVIQIIFFGMPVSRGSLHLSFKMIRQHIHYTCPVFVLCIAVYITTIMYLLVRSFLQNSFKTMEAFILTMNRGTSGIVLDMFTFDAAKLLSAQMRKGQSRNLFQ